MTAARSLLREARVYGLKGDWEVENRGITPDIEVEVDSALARQGRDPQLEKAVEVILDQLEKNPLPTYKRPEYPNYHQASAARITSGTRSSIGMP